ncbi:hypothetical protein LX69_01067 [Breznakibacter xylanolyticus]|uniref:PepSY-associated transmembrane protein n=1 Tax=Breznakibacter xylanolyticus TaxID=990 RepID=A0A2W7P3P3_9BACT|nr:hypothetical protein [Breznakibacter xylanolyticus]PZX18032.1 hypothetical protein LX69_01067 [Breznakibacter xylanolyticus]
METKQKKSVQQIMRLLHRDIGFLVLGLTVIYALSGIVLIYRDTDFLKREVTVEKTIDPNLDAEALGQVLRKRHFKITATHGSVMEFEQGTYNAATGEIRYTSKELPDVLRKFNTLHKSASRSLVHWAGLVYGVLLLFLAVSSLWMYKPGTLLFRRGLIFAGIGVVVAVFLLLWPG